MLPRLLLPVCLAAPLIAAPVPPSMFHCIDPNIEVTVWASSPMLRNPTNIDIDKDGRIWVAEGVNYRQHFDRQPEGDRIMVLEDTDGDGKADKSWPFVQEPFLRAPLGVAVIGNKVIVSMAPDLVVYTDKDGDLKFDAAKGDTREVLLTGFFGRNHDHSLHSVTVGPDGKWYFSCGNCGAKFTDKSGKTFRIGSVQNTSWWPKDPAMPDGDPNEIAGQKSDDGRVYVGGFIARMDPDGSNVEILAHNLRNSFENCVTSFGDIFASDNDDQPACRVFHVLEGGNYGFASADGQRTWQADRRPGQSIATATWRQEDPGVAPACDVYGGGSPTGCVFYENGALGAQHEGTLLVCEPGRNVIFGYKPQPEGAGWKLERFDFLTTNKEGAFTGTDFTGGNKTAKAEDVKTLFRPSDIAVGPDGALYVADWFDPRVGGHADMDDSLSGTIYRIAPKGFKPKVPKFELPFVDGKMSKVGAWTAERVIEAIQRNVFPMEGVLEALKSPAVHVRALGAICWRNIYRMNSGLGPSAEGFRCANMRRELWEVGERGFKYLTPRTQYLWFQESYIPTVVEGSHDLSFNLFSDSDESSEGMVKVRTVMSSLRRQLSQSRHHMAAQIAPELAIRGGMLSKEASAFIRMLPPNASLQILTSWALDLEGINKSICLHSWAKAAEGCEATLFEHLMPKLGNTDSVKWSEKFAALAFQLHPPQTVPAFKTRALAAALPEKARLEALTAIGFNDTIEAAQAMLEVAAKTGGARLPPSPDKKGQSNGSAGASPHHVEKAVRETALWWLLNRKDCTWKSHGLNAALKERGIYDSDKIQLLAAPLPDPVPPAFSIADAAKLAGDAKRGEVVSQKCYVCHKIGANGVEYGPDLTTWGRAQGTEVILRSLIDPDAEIAHGFAGTEIQTTDGLTIAGLLLSDSDPAIIRSAGVTQMVPKAKIKSKTGMTRSLMMSATQLGLSAQEAADVAAFLKNR